jgi:hypothetical protein
MLSKSLNGALTEALKEPSKGLDRGSQRALTEP